MANLRLLAPARPDTATGLGTISACRPGTGAVGTNPASGAQPQALRTDRVISATQTVTSEFALTLSGDRNPYHRHAITVWRNTLGRLSIEIESYTAEDPQGNPDNVCARAESGPVVRLGRAMFKLMPRHMWAQTALQAGMPIHTYVEWVNDLELAWQAAQLENRGPALLPVPYRAEV